jgi:hypothetical protein
LTTISAMPSGAVRMERTLVIFIDAPSHPQITQNTQIIL